MSWEALVTSPWRLLFSARLTGMGEFLQRLCKDIYLKMLLSPWTGKNSTVWVSGPEKKTRWPEFWGEEIRAHVAEVGFSSWPCQRTGCSQHRPAAKLSDSQAWGREVGRGRCVTINSHFDGNSPPWWEMLVPGVLLAGDLQTISIPEKEREISILSFFLVPLGPQNQSQVIELGCRHLFPQNSLLPTFVH